MKFSEVMKMPHILWNIRAADQVGLNKQLKCTHYWEMETDFNFIELLINSIYK